MTKILDNFFPKEVDKYLETFTGGGSVLLHIVQKFNPHTVYANDIDSNLINYYNNAKTNPQAIIDECLEVKNKHTKETFAEEFRKLNREKASHFFISNKTSFSGLNKNYAPLAYDRNFSVKCINKINDICPLLARQYALISLGCLATCCAVEIVVCLGCPGARNSYPH